MARVRSASHGAAGFAGACRCRQALGRFGAAVLLALLPALVGCACAAPRSTSRGASSTRSAILDTPATSGRSADLGEVQSAYQRFWQIAQHVDRQPPAQWRAVLAAVTAEPLLTRLVDGLQARIRAGYWQYGEVMLHAQVIEVHGNRASVLDCQDASRAGELDTATGLPTNLGRVRTPIAATLTQGSDGRWRVSDARYLDEDC